MSDLETLKERHPEWCWKCGVEETVCDCWGLEVPVITALIAKALEDEARIKELTQRDPFWYDASPADAFRWWAEDRRALYAAQAEISELGKDAVPRSRYRALAAKLAAAEAKVRELEAEGQAMLMDAMIGSAIIAAFRGEPVSDFEESFPDVADAKWAHVASADGQRLKAITSANAALEAKLLSADDALMECFSIACLQGGAYRISREAEAAHGDACDRYEARKKGAEHGE